MMDGHSTMSTKSIRLATIDPNFIFPIKPRYLEGLVRIDSGNKLLFHGNESLQILSGSAAEHFLPILLPALDGTKTVEEIIAMFDEYAPQDIISVLTLLFMRGLLDDAAGDEGIDTTDIPPHIIEYFKRNNDSTRANRSAVEGLDRLRNSNLLVIKSSNQYGDLLVNELKQMGINNLTTQLLDEHIDIGNHTFVVIFCTESLDHERLRNIDTICKSHRIPWLLVRTENNAGIIGPYFEDIETSPYESYEMEVKKQELMEFQTPQAFIEMWESYCAIEIVYFLTKLAPTVIGNEYLVFNFEDWTYSTKKLNDNPNVPYVASKFENAIAFPSRHLFAPKIHQVHYNPKNLNLARESKEYPSAPLVPLPWEDITSLTGDFHSNAYLDLKPAGLVSIETLATLLIMSGGMKQSADHIKRWAPSGGNLGSPNFYVIANRVRGLEPNLYYFQEKDQSLAILGKLNQIDKYAEIINHIIGNQECEIPDALLAITGDLDRTAGKYNGFAFKIIHLDAGVALSQMQAVSNGLGLKVKMFYQWNEQPLIDFLGVNKYKEPVVALAGVYGKGDVL